MLKDRLTLCEHTDERAFKPMSNPTKKLYRIQRLLVTLCYFVALVNWAMPLRLGTVGVFPILLAITVIVSSFSVIRLRFSEEFRTVYNQNALIIKFFLIYLIITVFNNLVAKYPIFTMVRYIVPIEFSLLAACTISAFSSDSSRSIITRVRWAIGFAGLFILLVSLLKRVIEISQGNVSDTISLKPDYNQFCNCLLYCAAIAYESLATRKKLFCSPKYRYIFFLIICLLAIAIYFSSSRRSVVYFVVFCLLVAVQQIKSRGLRREFVLPLLFIFVFAVAIFPWLGRLNARSMSTTNGSSVSTEQSATTRLNDRYKSTLDGSGLHIRLLIWQGAIDYIAEESPFQLLFGGGSSNSWDIYDAHSDNKTLIDAYYGRELGVHEMNPHNVLLQDLLEGGLVLVIAGTLLFWSILMKIVQLVKNHSSTALMTGYCFVMLVINSMLGSGFGLIGEIYLYLVLIKMLLLDSQTIFNAYE